MSARTHHNELRTIVIGLIITALVVTAIYAFGQHNLNSIAYDKSCPVSGARCTDSSDALVRGCHG